MTPNWAGPVAVLGSPRTATRVTPGAICLSSSSHFPLMLYSYSMKPVALPPRPRQAVDETGADWIGDEREHDRHGAIDPLDCHHALGARGEDDVGSQRDQFHCV